MMCEKKEVKTQLFMNAFIHNYVSLKIDILYN